jgi:hypothetical protein
MVFRLAAAPYGIQRSIMISPKMNNYYDKSNKRNYLRGRGGRGGRRSMMTDRGGTGKAAKRRMTVWEATEGGGGGGFSRRISGGG